MMTQSLNLARSHGLTSVLLGAAFPEGRTDVRLANALPVCHPALNLCGTQLVLIRGILLLVVPSRKLLHQLPLHHIRKVMAVLKQSLPKILEPAPHSTCVQPRDLCTQCTTFQRLR
jgi:hypothetical protein